MLSNVTDLVLSAKQGERYAMARLCEATQAPLEAFCLRLCRDFARAQDLAQDTMVRVLENLQKLKEPSRYFPWIFRTARHLWLDYLKSPKNRTSSLDADDLPHPERTDAVGRLEIERLLGRMEEKSKAAILLVDGIGLSYEEAARRLGLSAASLRCRLLRARRLFQADFAR